MINNFSKSDDLLEVIFSNSQIMFAYMDTKFNFIRVNKAYAEANGRTQEFFVGKNHFDLFPDPENKKIFQNVILTGKPYLAKGKYFEHPKLGISYWDWHLHPLKDHYNRINAIILSLIDVTNRIELHSNIMSQLGDAILAVDMESHVTYWNPAAERLYGIKSSEAIGKLLRDLYKYEWVNPEGEKESEKALRESGFWRGENIHIKRNGERITVESTVNVIKDNENRNLGALAIIRDITEKKKIEKIKDQFITSVTHELRTPLVSIKGYIDFLLMDKAELPENISSSLLVVQEQSNRLLRITDDLLDYRRLISGLFELEWKSLNLIDIISKSILETQALMREKKQNLQVEVGDSPMWINGDNGRLVQVVSNLLINASKFTSREGTITVRRSEGSDVFKVSISDTGIGLRAEDLQRVFEPFATIDKPTYIKGTGIGLSVAKGIIEAHEGSLWAESEGLGCGSTFSFTIPIRKN